MWKKLTARDKGLIESGYVEGFAQAQSLYQKETQRITELYRKLLNKRRSKNHEKS